MKNHTAGVPLPDPSFNDFVLTDENSTQLYGSRLVYYTPVLLSDVLTMPLSRSLDNMEKHPRQRNFEDRAMRIFRRIGLLTKQYRDDASTTAKVVSSPSDSRDFMERMHDAAFAGVAYHTTALAIYTRRYIILNSDSLDCHKLLTSSQINSSREALLGSLIFRLPLSLVSCVQPVDQLLARYTGTAQKFAIAVHLRADSESFVDADGSGGEEGDRSERCRGGLSHQP